MKDEWDFDDDDDGDDHLDKLVAASPRKGMVADAKDVSSSSPSISTVSLGSIASGSSTTSRSKNSMSSVKSAGLSPSKRNAKKVFQKGEEGGRRGEHPLATSSQQSLPSSSSCTSSSVTSPSQQHASPATTSSSLSQPRTRAARMKASGMTMTMGPNKRKVRFELGFSASHSPASSKSSTSSSVSTLPSTLKQQGYRSFAEIPNIANQRKKQLRRKTEWNLKEDDDDDDIDGNDSIRKAGENNAKPPKTKSPAPPVLRSASVDVYAIQDTVKLQRLVDELRYCCDTLRSSRKASRQLEAVADLSLLLSNRKTRHCLLFSNFPPGAEGGEDAQPLAILLDLMEWMHEKMGSSVTTTDAPSENGNGRLTVSGATNSPRASSSNSTHSTQMDQGGLSPAVIEAMGLVWHFLSIDCTMANESRSSITARRLRENLLSNHHAIQGLLEMVVNDPHLNPMARKNRTNHITASVGTLSQESGLTLSSSSSVPNSPESTESVDPTVAGRWRKRRRKLMTQVGAAMDSIPEGTVQNDVGTDSKPDDFWSFTSESTNGKVGENGSIASCSQTSDAEQQLQKVLEKVKESLEDSAFDVHPCDAKKNELLSRLPLLSLCRIVSGKFEGDDKSCIDDDMNENPPDDDEDELSRNPLLRTNAMLAESGAIPYIARAASNASIAIMNHLMKGAPCNGGEAYIRWKFCKLTSLVDDACLLTDSNRLAFSTEGFASETGGYLLINVATALRALSETGKLFDDNGWGEVTLSALRTLTSLTHDNEMAARDLEASSVSLNGSRPCNSLAAIVDVLYQSSKHDGDLIIFCLNALANILESGGSWETFAKLTVGEEKESFLKWLSCHVVTETKSFQDALVESSFGSIQDRHSERQLDKSENEALMMAGNALIFLACILVRTSAESSKKVQEEIMAQLPGRLESTKLLFIKNTLKAFCNLYHFSVGALSLAIVAPVKKLLSDLEAAYENISVQEKM